MNSRSFLLALLSLGSLLHAEDIALSTSRILRVPQPRFSMGSPEAPRSRSLLVADRRLLLDGHSVWYSQVGFSFTGRPEGSWRDSLLRCKADGINLLLVPLDWSLHEPRQGAYSWSGQLALRSFLELAAELDFKVILSLGQSVPSNGFRLTAPSWLSKRDLELGPASKSYLQGLEAWYAELARQLKGLRWREGGPVIGLEWEGGADCSAEHLLTLKQLALSKGLDFPLYARSPQLSPSTPLPQGAFVSVPAKLPESLWDFSAMPGADQLPVLRNELPSTLGLGDFSQRRLNLFLREFGENLANMETYTPALPEAASPAFSASSTTSAPVFFRSDGNAGFLFLNGARLPRGELRFALTLHSFDAKLNLPQQPQPLPATLRSIWPVNLPLSSKITLGYATAMPLCILDEDGVRTVFLAAPEGMQVELGISADLGVKVTRNPSLLEGVVDGNFVYRHLSGSREPLMEISAPGSPLVRIVLLSEADSMKLVKVRWLGQTRVLLWSGLAIQDGDRLDLYDYAGKRAAGSLHVYPDPAELIVGSRKLQGRRDGFFTTYEIGSRK